MNSETLFNTTEDGVKLGFFFSKIDEEKRTVSGFATLDNIDSHGDIIDADGSISAFRRFRGGLREMHTNNAVGTIIDFEEMKKYDEEKDRLYRGVYISARVSKGAQSTWEKVLDGTLKGFSIGGKIKKTDMAKDETGASHRVIKDYDLIEVSLVDNPANPLANVLTVQKLGDTYVYNDLDKAEAGSLSVGDFVSWNSSGGRAQGRITRISSSSTLNVPDSSFSVEGTEDDPAALIRLYRDGEATDTIVGHRFSTLTKIDSIEKAQYNILYHNKTGDVILSEKEEAEDFVNIGWVESDTETDKIRQAVQKYKTSQEDSEEEDEIMSHENSVLKALGKILSKEVLNMRKDNIAKGEEVQETTEEIMEKSADEVTVTEVELEEVTKDAGEEVASEEEVVEKASDEVSEETPALNVDDIVSKIQEAVVGAVEKAVDAARESKEAAESVKSSFDETLADVTKEISGLKETLENLAGRVESVESNTAVKKSSDILSDEEDNDEEETSFWRGSGFLSANDLLKG
jgi:hypothetical protein